MSGDKLFVDTNIVLYLLGGDETLATLLYEKELYISFITQLELLGFKELTKKEEKILIEFIDQCKVIEINNIIKQDVIRLRKQYNVKLPDCIIISSSMYLDIPLITADADFKKVKELDLLYYEKIYK
jgi:predicted nucleic acid-binding protein